MAKHMGGSVFSAARFVLVASLVALSLIASTLSTAAPVAAELTNDERLFDTRAQNQWGVDGLDPGSGNF